MKAHRKTTYTERIRIFETFRRLQKVFIDEIQKKISTKKFNYTYKQLNNAKYFYVRRSSIFIEFVAYNATKSIRQI